MQKQRWRSLAGFDPVASLTVADIGCGTGASTLVLARQLNAAIAAADLLPDFLARLERRARDAGLTDSIATLKCAMDGNRQ